MSSNGPTTWLVESADADILAFSRHGEDPWTAAAATSIRFMSPGDERPGIGKALLDHDLQFLAERGLGTVTLWVFEQNQAARNLYSSFGSYPTAPAESSPSTAPRRSACAAAATPGERPGQP